MAIATKLTVEEYYAVSVEGDRKQLVEGEIVVNEPKVLHSRLQRDLLVAIQAWTVAEAGRGEVFLPTDVRVDDRNVYGPDLLWFADGREPEDPDGYPKELPDLCVEIRSESTWRYDIGAKKNVYERAGMPELWLVDSKSKSVLVYRRSAPGFATYDEALELGEGEVLISPLLPGFSLAVGEFFKS